MKKRNLVLMAFSVATILFSHGLYAFENAKTHPAITERAATNTASTLDDYLKTITKFLIVKGI